MHLKNNKQI